MADGNQVCSIHDQAGSVLTLRSGVGSTLRLEVKSAGNTSAINLSPAVATMLSLALAGDFQPSGSTREHPDD